MIFTDTPFSQNSSQYLLPSHLSFSRTKKGPIKNFPGQISSTNLYQKSILEVLKNFEDLFNEFCFEFLKKKRCRRLIVLHNINKLIITEIKSKLMVIFRLRTRFKLQVTPKFIKNKTPIIKNTELKSSKQCL